MEFLYPTVLFSLFATAIPVLIHLLDWQKPIPVAFTNVRFLREINHKSNKSRQIKNWLILLCRILFLFFLILAFAQPYFPSNQKQTFANQVIAIYADNSFSMEQKEGNQTLLDQALKEIDKIPSLYGSTTKYVYTDNFFKPSDKSLINGDKLKERITETQFSPNAKTLEEIYNHQIKLKEKIGKSTPISMIWISDFQKSTIGNLKDLKVDTSIQIYLLPMQASENKTQIALDSLWLENLFIKTSENNKLFVKLKNFGGKSAKNIPIKLYFDNIQSGSATLDLEPNQSKIISFDFNISSGNKKSGKISFEDKNLTFDNDFYFNLKVAPEINILLISDFENNIIKSVYANESIFKLTEKPFGQISVGDLAQASLVIVNGVDKLNFSELNLLKKFQNKKGVLLLFPSKNYQKNNWEDSLETSKFSVKQDIANIKPYPISFPDIKNPFFAKIFEKTSQNTEMPWAKTTIFADKYDDVLLNTDNDHAFLVDFNERNKHTIVCTSPLSEAYSNWYQHALFVPIMYKTAFISSNENQELAYSFNQKNKEMVLNQLKTDLKYHLKNESTFNYIPNQYLADNKLFIDIPTKNMVSGYYQLTYKDSVVREIALNYPKSESEIATYSSQQLKTILSKHKNITILPSLVNAPIEDILPNTIKQTPLWKYCILIALFFMLAEIILLRIFSKMSFNQEIERNHS
jgi:hypothetical protein